MTIWSYLLMIQNQHLSVVRSQAWNTALAVAEAGAEEALAQLNPGVILTNVDRTANGWGLSSNGTYGPISRTLSTGTYAVSYTTDLCPIIYSAGSATVPFMSAQLSRVIRVTTTNLPIFNVGLGAVNGITMNGSGLATDSFNSSSTNLSTNGQYTATLASTNGNVGSVNGPVNLGNHTIAGNLYVGPSAPYSGSGTILGSVYHDLNAAYPDVVLPAYNWTISLGSLPIVAPDGNSYNHVFLTSGAYTVDDTGTIYVGTNVSAVVEIIAASWSPSSVRIAGGQTNSGQLTVYMLGASTSLGGGVSVDNGIAANFNYFGLPSNTSITCGGGSSFVGTIYAPEASLTLSGGGGGGTINLVGACIVNNVTMNGHYAFHYDEALTKYLTRGYTAVSWQEL
jgi:hypothetical protein